ncbi:MAG: alpha-amylase family glycosyl hydrolase [Anaerolineales bacterium]
MDFAFGTYINDTLKLANHRADRSGIQHQNHITPIDPLPGESVIIHLVTSGISGIEHAALIYTTDEITPQGGRGTAQCGQVVMFEKTTIEWDSIVWDYLTHWQAVIPPQADNTLVRYIISGWSADGPEVFADYPPAQEQVQHVAMGYFGNIPPDTPFEPSQPSQPHIFTYHVDRTQAPDWASDAIIYQLFVDRFYVGDGHTWRQTDDFNAVFGGTLWGVCDKLDYLAALGVNCIWLSPVWASPSYHGYDVVDYRRVEPRLGGEDALRAVVTGAHQRGMRVLLDMACNHLSSQHPYFIEAQHNPDSPYRDWFIFGERFEAGYKGFFNVAEMPEINLAHPAARAWMIENALYWLREYDIDGYRLDYANGPGPDFWTYFRRACKGVKPDCLLFGEIIEPPQVLRQYIGRLDGCLDFPLNDALRRTYATQHWDAAQCRAFLANHRAYFSSAFVMPAFLDNHDMDRFTYIADNDPERLKTAVQFQMTQPQPVIIYYGSEVGLAQPRSTHDEGLSISRVAMVWDARQNQEMLDFYKAQIAQRKQRKT